jgi:uncharacterized protein
MNTDVQNLIRLQSVDEEIVYRTEDAAALPKRLAALETALASEKQRLVETEAALGREEQQRQHIENTIAGHLAKLKKYRDQVSNVKTSEQLAAIEHEISFAEAEVRRLEEAALESLGRTEELERDLATAQKSVQQQTVVIESERVQVQVAETVHQARIKMLRTQREGIRTEIGEQILSTYDRVAAVRRTGLARAHDRQCLGCQMSLRPQVWNQLRDGDLLTCENCGRLLYWDPAKETVADPKQVSSAKT